MRSLKDSTFDESSVGPSICSCSSTSSASTTGSLGGITIHLPRGMACQGALHELKVVHSINSELATREKVMGRVEVHDLRVPSTRSEKNRDSVPYGTECQVRLAQQDSLTP